MPLAECLEALGAAHLDLGVEPHAIVVERQRIDQVECGDERVTGLLDVELDRPTGTCERADGASRRRGTFAAVLAAGA
jgi:hypothetical protein